MGKLIPLPLQVKWGWPKEEANRQHHRVNQSTPKLIGICLLLSNMDQLKPALIESKFIQFHEVWMNVCRVIKYKQKKLFIKKKEKRKPQLQSFANFTFKSHFNETLLSLNF